MSGGVRDGNQFVTAGRAVCGAKKRQGEGNCTQPAGWGTDHPGFGHCKLHGGASPNGSKMAAKMAIKASSSLGFHFGQQIDIDPHEALLALVREAYGNVVFLRTLVQELESGRRLVAGDDGSDDLSANTKSDADIEDLDELVAARPSRRPSIAGRVDWETLKAAPHVLVAMYGDWCDRLARYSKMAVEAGVDERRVQLAEQEGHMLAAVLRGVLTDLDLPAEMRDMVPQLIRKHIGAITAQASVVRT